MDNPEASPTFAEIFAVFLKEAREKRGLSQVELEDKSGVKQSTISALERAVTTRPVKSSHIEALIKAMGMDAPRMCEKLDDIAQKWEMAIQSGTPIVRPTSGRGSAERRNRYAVERGGGKLLVRNEHREEIEEEVKRLLPGAPHVEQPQQRRHAVKRRRS